jgi:hypothetical protein
MNDIIKHKNDKKELNKLFFNDNKKNINNNYLIESILLLLNS